VLCRAVNVLFVGFVVCDCIWPSCSVCSSRPSLVPLLASA